MEAHKALELIEQVESGVADMYAGLQAMFSGSDSKDLEMFFYRLFLEVSSHVNMVRMERDRVQHDPADFGRVSVEHEDFRTVMDQVAVVRGMPRDRVGEIMLQCYLIESTLAEQYVVASLKASHEEVRYLFDMLGRGFRDHLAALAVRVKELGADMTKLDMIRRCPRVSYSGRALINEKIPAKSVDISESGIFLLTTQTFPPGAVLVISFSLTGGVVSTQARVRYSVQNAGIGLSFDSLEEAHRILIRDYVDCALQKIPPDPLVNNAVIIDDDHSGTA